MEELRELFIAYQKQFYNENEMHDLISQSDQNNAIRRGDYDATISLIENLLIKMSEERIEVKIKPKHFKNSSSFISIRTCPLALAVQDHFQITDDDMNCDCEEVSIYIGNDENVFLIEGEWCNNTPGKRNGTTDTVDGLIQKAKQKKKVGTYTVTLIKK